MRKRMKRNLLQYVSRWQTPIGPGMSMVTMTYADEITKENQQDQEISNDQNNTWKTGKTVIQMTEKRLRMILIKGNDSGQSTGKSGRKTLRKKIVKEDNMEAQQEEPSEETDSEETDSEAAVTQRKVLNINDGWNFSTNDTSTAGREISCRGAGENGVVNCPHSWEYVHPRQSYIPPNEFKDCYIMRRQLIFQK